MSLQTEVAVIGAGPYGLSIAAHLLHFGVRVRIFGRPMHTWSAHMPKGMLLKSDGFASSLSEPTGKFTIGRYCAEHAIEYDDLKLPVKLQTFIDYGVEFQKRFVPNLDHRTVTHITGQPGEYEVTLDDGETFSAKYVVVAAGITHFEFIPENLAHLPANLVSHSAQNADPEAWRGKDVTVVGGGASAIDLAVLLHEAGATVNVVARRKALRFLEAPSPKGRSLWQKIRNPSSGLGPGLKSRFYCDAPGLFRHLPLETRLRLVDTSLGPAPGYPMRGRMEGKVTADLGISNLQAAEHNGKVRLTYTLSDGSQKELLTDQVVAATGYRPNIDRLSFLDDAIRSQIQTVRKAPVLSANFESSVPGLFFVGIAASYSFGPLMRFAYGADFAAHRIGRHLPSRIRKSAPRRVLAQPGPAAASSKVGSSA
jgi:thioredoxin reductase